MGTVSLTPQSVGDSHDQRHVGLAWWCLAGLPVAVAAAFVIGEGIATWAGLPEGVAASPGTAALVLALVAALVAVPTTLAWRYARLAAARGDLRGRTPAITITVLAVGFLGINILSWALSVIT